MEVLVVGYEGKEDEDCPLSWGVAAYLDYDEIRNSFTGYSSPLSEAKKLENDGHLYLFRAPISVPNVDLSTPMIVMNLLQSSEFFATVDLAKEDIDPSIYFKEQDNKKYMFFPNKKCFKIHSYKVINRIIKSVLESKNHGNSGIINLGLTLIHNDPILCAFRVYYREEALRQRALQLTLSLMKNDSEKTLFYEVYLMLERNRLYEDFDSETKERIYGISILRNKGSQIHY